MTTRLFKNRAMGENQTRVTEILFAPLNFFLTNYFHYRVLRSDDASESVRHVERPSPSELHRVPAGFGASRGEQTTLVRIPLPLTHPT